MTIEAMREQIDELDLQLLALFETRLALSKKIGTYKLKNQIPISNHAREKQIICQVKDTCKPENEIYAIPYFKTILSLSKKVQQSLAKE